MNAKLKEDFLVALDTALSMPDEDLAKELREYRERYAVDLHATQIPQEPCAKTHTPSEDKISAKDCTKVENSETKDKTPP